MPTVVQNLIQVIRQSGPENRDVFDSW